jgi:hypothetical protein
VQDSAEVSPSSEITFTCAASQMVAGSVPACRMSGAGCKYLRMHDAGDVDAEYNSALQH